MYYRRDGSPCSLGEWIELFENNKYQRVAETTLPDGKWVSTVWLGINHGFRDGHILIFETMIFKSKENLSELDCYRYSSEKEALQGHKAMVLKWKCKQKFERGRGTE